MKIKFSVQGISILSVIMLSLSACNELNQSFSPNGNLPRNLTTVGNLASIPGAVETQADAPLVIQIPDPIAAQSPDPSNMIKKPIALIYKGTGSCSLDQGDAGKNGYGCSEASADAAILAGFQYRFVGPTDLPENASQAQIDAIFGNAKVWIQPGGISNWAYYAMTGSLSRAIINFVSNGGGYVGLCAGAFLGADWLNLIDAYASEYQYTPIQRDLTYTYLPINWSGTKRSIYFEGGPYFNNIGSTVQVVATFADGYAAAVRDSYGKGRVFLSGPHPEAPSIWGTEDGENDPDGSDLFIAADMISWAAQK